MKVRKLLFFQWKSFMNRGIANALEKLDVKFETFFYQFQDWEIDDRFCQLFHDRLKKGEYDAVLSVNFSPLISNICEEFEIPYISWVYDSPLHIRDLEPMKNSCNKIYLFDREQAEEYDRQGMNVNYLPLAVDTDAFKKAIQKGNRMHDMDISMVGKLYQTEYAYFAAPLDNYLKGYLEGIINSQMKVYGGYLIPELATVNLLDKMNEIYKKAAADGFQMEKRELEYMLSCEVTGRERYLALMLLSAHFPVYVYTDKVEPRLKSVHFCGYADYETMMPKIFSASKINLNISLKTIRSGIPLRILDIAGCGGFIFSNFQIELEEYFRIGQECEVYQNIEDLLLKTEFYLKHDELRRQIAQAGLERVKRDFTFEERLRTIFSI